MNTPTPTNVCVHCGAAVRTINYAMGPEVMHVDRHASFPTQHQGTAWRYCRMTVASLEPVTPEPVTLTDQEDVALADWWMRAGGDHEASALDGLVAVVEGILAARGVR